MVFRLPWQESTLASIGEWHTFCWSQPFIYHCIDGSAQEINSFRAYNEKISDGRIAHSLEVRVSHVYRHCSCWVRVYYESTTVEMILKTMVRSHDLGSPSPRPGPGPGATFTSDLVLTLLSDESLSIFQHSILKTRFLLASDSWLKADMSSWYTSERYCPANLHPNVTSIC